MGTVWQWMIDHTMWAVIGSVVLSLIALSATSASGTRR